jgi:hypothetical protein
VTIPADMDVTQKREKKLQYKIFCTEIQRMLLHEMYDQTSHNCSHRNCNKRFKAKFGNRIRKTLADSLPKIPTFGNISRNTGQQVHPNDAVVGTDKLSRNVGKLLATYTA